MRLAIVGVGQTLDFQTKEMVDVLQVELPDGQIISIPTSNEAANQLVQLVMGNGEPEYDDGHHARPDLAEMRRQAPQTLAEEYDGPQPIGEMTSDGAVFGGGPTFTEIAEIDVGEQLPTRQQAASSAKQDDRSAVPTRVLPASMVDEKGNPIMRGSAPAGLDDEDDDDPGEQL